MLPFWPWKASYDFLLFHSWLPTVKVQDTIHLQSGPAASGDVWHVAGGERGANFRYFPLGEKSGSGSKYLKEISTCSQRKRKKVSNDGRGGGRRKMSGTSTSKWSSASNPIFSCFLFRFQAQCLIVQTLKSDHVFIFLILLIWRSCNQDMLQYKYLKMNLLLDGFFHFNVLLFSSCSHGYFKWIQSFKHFQ